jgi:predicted RNA-binding protein with TRAM domain
MRFERRGFGGKRFGSRVDIPKPVKVGEEYDVEINEVGSKGDGIARVKNFVVFINGVKQGEKAHIKITDVRNRFAIGEKVEATTEPKEEVKVEKKVEEAPEEVEVEKEVFEQEESEEEEETEEEE